MSGTVQCIVQEFSQGIKPYINGVLRGGGIGNVEAGGRRPYQVGNPVGDIEIPAHIKLFQHFRLRALQWINTVHIHRHLRQGNVHNARLYVLVVSGIDTVGKRCARYAVAVADIRPEF